MAFQGIDLFPLWTEMMDKVTDDAAGAGLGMDLSVIAQLRGDKPTGLAIQQDSLNLHQVFATGAKPARAPPCACWRWRRRRISAPTRRWIFWSPARISRWPRFIWAQMCPCRRSFPPMTWRLWWRRRPHDGEHALAVIETLAKNWPRAGAEFRPRGSANWNATGCIRLLPALPALPFPPTLRMTRERAGRRLQRWTIP